MGWDRIGDWIATGIVAAMTWSAGLGALEPAGAIDGSGQHHMLGWAQSTDQPSIEQVGEGGPEDAEALDQGAPPAQTTGDAQAQSGEDVELLDQGAPPASVPAAAPAPAAAPPTTIQATTVSTTDAAAPAQEMGPRLPEGFGTSPVHVSAGRSGFPIGLEDCHVGVVTGRAYVGLDCNEFDDVVGHARSFDEFPFIPIVDFPFEGDEEFFTNPDFPFNDEDDASSDDGFFSSGRGDRDDTLVVSAGSGANGATADEIARRGGVVSGDGSITVAQRTRDRDPRVRVNDRGSNGAKKNSDKQNKNGNVSSASNDEKNSGSANDNDRKKDKSKAKSDSKSKSKAKAQKKGKDKKAKAKSGKDKKQKAKGEKKRKRNRDR